MIVEEGGEGLERGDVRGAARRCLSGTGASEQDERQSEQPDTHSRFYRYYPLLLQFFLLVKALHKAAAKVSTKQTPEQVSELTTNRLSVYLRCLNELDDAGVRTISSQSLAERFRLNAAQIRKDLAYFGEFGVRGVGYYVRDLKRHLRQILGLDQKLRVAILGAGNLGLALADYPGFRQEGFEISALFDTLSTKVGQHSRAGVPTFDIHDLKKIVRRDGIRIAVIAVPAASAQQVVDLVVAAGIKAVLNFSPGSLEAPPDVKLKSVDLTVSLESLSFFLAHGDEE